MSQRWFGVGLVVVLGLVWFALEERPRGASNAEPAVALKAQQQVPADAHAESHVEAAPAALAATTAPAQVATPAVDAPPPEGPAIEHALSLRASGDEAGAETALKDVIRKAATLKEAARAGFFLAKSAADAGEHRQYLSAALEAGVVYGAEYEDVGAQLRALNQKPAESLQPQLAAETLTVGKGDSLWKLCNTTIPKRFGVTPEVGLVKLVNGLGNGALSVGQVLHVPKQALAIRVDCAQHGLVAWLGNVAVCAYRVGLGRDDRTPRRTFTVLVKQENPAWFFNGRTVPYGDPENILGTRWMGFDRQEDASGFGIHGTALPESIGKNESMGCVRMRNAEVEELFELVARGTQVTIS